MKAETLFVALPSGQNFGWGICGYYLKKEISKRVKTKFPEINSESGAELPGKLFTALTNVNFKSFIKARGIENYGYTFFENNLTDLSKINAKKYDLILAGSSWCLEKLQSEGIINSEKLIQGIDPEIFYPIIEEKPDERFVIFSGGKFELRKGQDLVLKAIKILQEKYNDIYLINSWYNMWPATMLSMQQSGHIKFNPSGNTWREIMSNIYALNEIDNGRIQTYPSIPYKKQRDIFKRTDLAVFPNRCEGGTNLVMMEYMACGKPVIASYTSGHKDILNSENSIMLTQLKNFDIFDENKKLIAEWQEPSLEELIDKIEYAYNNRGKIKEIGLKAGEHLKKFTWGNSAEQLIKSIY